MAVDVFLHTATLWSESAASDDNPFFKPAASVNVT